MLGFLLLLAAASPPQELVAAARAGDRARISALLKAGGPVDSRDGEGSTALMAAALRNDEEMVRLLLETGADPNLRNSRGETALLLAGGRVPGIVRQLLEAGADPNARDNEGQTPLIAAASSHPESVKLLLGRGANVAAKDNYGVVALTVAEASGQAEIAGILRGAGAQLSPEDRLHEAIRRGDEAEVRSLLREGADVNALDTDLFQSPLMTAIQNHRLEILVVLVEAGADPTVAATGWDNDGDNALLMAARIGSPWGLRTVLRARSQPKDLGAALFAGCAHDSVVRVLLEMGVRPATTNARGETPLMCAAAAGAVDSVRTLLQAGADPRARSHDGSTALGRALQGRHEAVVALLKRSLDGK